MLLPAAVLTLSIILLPGTSLAQTRPINPQGTPKTAVLKKTDPYLDSAHGSPQKGVSRPEKAREGFARANCSNCHEFHGKTDVSGSGSGADKSYPYTLYALNFDIRSQTGMYSESTNFCFSCHNTNGSVQKVTNYDFSQSMGCSTQLGPIDILGAFNQSSRHNLYDIWKFLDAEKQTYSWFTVESNPCSACHHPHLARSNKDNPRDVSFSPLSRPGDHNVLWTGSMEDGYSVQYEPPFCSNENNREPSASQNADQARAGMIDYISLCTDCHNEKETLYSSTLERNILQINWGKTGDIHGDGTVNKTGGLAVKPPYKINSMQNYILSCLDCHEPHGSSNTAMLRTWVNSDKLMDSITTSIVTLPGTGEDTQNRSMGYLCMRCHEPDVDTGTDANNPPRWQTLHHGAVAGTGADTPSETVPPYTLTECASCHVMDSAATDTPLPIDCVNCHFHGASDDWLQEQATGRITF